MQITHQADYAIRTMMYLATLAPNQKVATSRIAEDYRIPPSFLTKIISQLSVAGLIHTARGAHGGVCLARAAENITLLDVLVAIDGPVGLNICVENPDACPNSPICQLHKFWVGASSELVEKLKKTTFAEIVKKGPAIPV
jgi:Rrf2 family protein